MSDSAKKEDPAVRHSIWKCYRHKCYYCKEFIEFKDMQIDHIIPSIYRREPERFTLALRSIGKEEGFEIDSLQNFIPACRTCNGEKGDSFNRQQILLALEKAEKQLPNIKEGIERFKKSVELGSKVAITKSDIEAGSASIEDLYNFLADDQEGFKDMEYSIYRNDESYNNYFYSKKNVQLQAFLPKHYDMVGSCGFNFRTIRIRGCTIALDHKEILDILFPGLNTDLKLGLRKFIICPEYNPNGHYIVRLAGNQFLVTSEEANNLCQIIDDFIKVYIESIQKIEKSLGTGEFEFSEEIISGFRLLKISGWLWRDIIKFANDFDYADGDSPWNIFSRNQGMLIIGTGRNMEGHGVHAILYPEWVKGHFRLYPNDEVWIVWKPGAFLDRDLKNLNVRQYWGPEFTLNWLIEQLIPYVIYHFKQKERPWFTKTSFLNFMKDFDITAYINCIPNLNNSNFSNFQSTDELTSLIGSLHICYIANHCYFEEKHLCSLYAALHLCFIHTKIEMEDYYHVTQILHFVKGSTLKDILKDIENYKIKLTDKHVKHDVVCDALNCILFLLNNRKNDLNKHEIQLILDYIEPLINFYRTKKLVEKYREYKSSLR
jgi:5-methylcytosine-specific restriction endonuclease McrA